jgi:Ca2+ transporting ATPase
VVSLGNANGQLDELIVSGTSYEPIGDIVKSDGSKVSSLPAKSHVVRDIARICSLCNDARIAYDNVRKRKNGIEKVNAMHILLTFDNL